MEIKWMGAVLVIFGCGGFGYSIAAAHRRQERLLRQLQRSLRLVRWELQYRLTALPELCRLVGKETDGVIQKVFLDMHRELNWQSAPDASGCMAAALRLNPDLPPKVRRILKHLGSVLGRFDLQGQLDGIRAVQEEISQALLDDGKDRQQRLRSYQTLGLCAGCALAILLA